jgi:hypothetical protein
MHRCNVFWYCWLSVILISFPFSPKFHRVVPLLQTYSIYKCVCKHVCFRVNIYLLDLPSTYVRKHVKSATSWMLAHCPIGQHWILTRFTLTRYYLHKDQNTVIKRLEILVAC